MTIIKIDRDKITVDSDKFHLEDVETVKVTRGELDMPQVTVTMKPED